MLIARWKNMLHHLSPRFHDFSNAFKWKLEGKKKNILKKKNQLIRDYKNYYIEK